MTPLKASESFASFWQRYGESELLPSAAKGNKHVAWESWQKKVKEWSKREGLESADETEFAKAVWTGYDISRRNRAAAKSAGVYMPRLQNISTYLNQWGWEVELDQSTGDLKRQAAVTNARTCGRDGCPERAQFRDFLGGWQCQQHELQEWANQNSGYHRERFRALMQRHPKPKAQSWQGWSQSVLAQSPLGAALLAKLKQRKELYGEPCKPVPACENSP